MNGLQMDQIAKIKVVGVGGGGCTQLTEWLKKELKVLILCSKYRLTSFKCFFMSK